jgi:hypothetical protein
MDARSEAADSRSGAIRASAVGVVSAMTMREGGTSASERTSCPGSISPPSARSSAARAELIPADPPRTNGQPMPCATNPRTRPNDAESGAPSDSIECAARPANSARAGASA